MFDYEGQLNRLLSQQRAEAEQTVSSTASFATYRAFAAAFQEIDGSTLSASTAEEQLSIDFASLTLLIDRWMNELNYLVDDIRLQLQMFDPIPYEIIDRVSALRFKVEYKILPAYETLKAKLADIETDFSNIAIAYKSLVESSFNDMLIFNNNHNDIQGDFSAFNDVSVYIHGIEDTGEKFLSNIPEVANKGDIVIHEMRDGGTEYYLIIDNDGTLELSDSMTEKEMKETSVYSSGDGRVHMVYETEYQNEHRQKTSNDLGKSLIALGLMHGDKNIHLHSHSYGGRRSWQFALDYPEYVKSITTIGTPYEKNVLASVGEGVANLTEAVPGAINRHPLEYNEHIEIDSLEGAVSGVKLNDNAYGDMRNTALDEVVTDVTMANPEIYDDLQEMYITAVTGRQSTVVGSLATDGAVSADSQSGNILSEYIDEQPVIKVFHVGLAHSAETTHDDFKEIMREVNEVNFR